MAIFVRQLGGVPAGAVGLVYGDPGEISGYGVLHPLIRKITFSGSTPISKQLAAMAGPYMKPWSWVDARR